MNDTRKMLSNSVIVFCGTIIASFFSYLFNMLMGRMLGPQGYGDMTAILSISMIFLTVGGAVLTIAMRYSSELYTKKNTEALTKLIQVFSKIMLFLGLTIFFLALIFSQKIALFFSVSSSRLVVAGFLSVIFGLLIAVNRGILQGVQKFVPLTGVNISEMLFRLVLGVLIVKIGFGVGGAIFATVLATVIAYFISFLPIKKTLNEKSATHENFKFDKKEIITFSLPTLAASILIAFSLNIDVLLVKHYFDPTQAGVYAAISTIGKIIVYLVSPIISVMFPMIMQKTISGEKHYKTLSLALFLTMIMSLVILAFYVVAPGFIIKLLYGVKFVDFSYLLPEVGLSMLLFSMVNLICNYYIAIKDFSFILIYLLVLVAQVVIVELRHDSVVVVVREFILANGLLFALLSFYYLYTKKTQLIAMIRKEYE